MTTDSWCKKTYSGLNRYTQDGQKVDINNVWAYRPSSGKPTHMYLNWQKSKTEFNLSPSPSTQGGIVGGSDYKLPKYTLSDAGDCNTFAGNDSCTLNNMCYQALITQAKNDGNDLSNISKNEVVGVFTNNPNGNFSPIQCYASIVDNNIKGTNGTVFANKDDCCTEGSTNFKDCGPGFCINSPVCNSKLLYPTPDPTNTSCTDNSDCTNKPYTMCDQQTKKCSQPALCTDPKSFATEGCRRAMATAKGDIKIYDDFYNYLQTNGYCYLDSKDDKGDYCISYQGYDGITGYMTDKDNSLYTDCIGPTPCKKYNFVTHPGITGPTYSPPSPCKYDDECNILGNVNCTPTDCTPTLKNCTYDENCNVIGTVNCIPVNCSTKGDDSGSNSGGSTNTGKTGGSSCSSDDQCQSGNCSGGTCLSGTTGSNGKSIGSSCTSSDDCTSGYCDTTTSKCATKPAKNNGTTKCSKDSDCTTGEKCDTTGKCVKKGGLSTTWIIIIAVSAGLLLLIIIAAVIIMSRKKKSNGDSMLDGLPPLPPDV